jgi:hypothetical protein
MQTLLDVCLSRLQLSQRPANVCGYMRTTGTAEFVLGDEGKATNLWVSAVWLARVYPKF